MIEVLKKQWFVVLIALIFTSFAIYYIYDTNKGKLPGKSIDGKDVVATIGEQTITADDLYEGLDKTMSGSVASVYFSRYVADQSVETTDALKEEAKTNAEGYRSYVEQTYGTATDDMIAASLKQLNFNSLEDYFLIEAKKTKLYQDYYDKHLEELFQPLCEEKNGRVLSHILIKMDDAENPTEEELAKIEKVDAALAEGEDFGDVAEKYSDDSSASDGGLLGYSDDDTSYVTAFKETAATLKKGEVSDWVKVTSTNYSGWHKILCVEDSYEGIIENKDVKESIYSAIESANSTIRSEIIWKAGKKLDISFADKELKAALLEALGLDE